MLNKPFNFSIVIIFIDIYLLWNWSVISVTTGSVTPKSSQCCVECFHYYGLWKCKCRVRNSLLWIKVSAPKCSAQRALRVNLSDWRMPPFHDGANFLYRKLWRVSIYFQNIIRYKLIKILICITFHLQNYTALE